MSWVLDDDEEVVLICRETKEDEFLSPADKVWPAAPRLKPGPRQDLLQLASRLASARQQISWFY